MYTLFADQVNINKAMWLPATVGLIMKILTGLLGGWAFALLLPDGSQRTNSEDILSVLLRDETPEVSQYAAYLWDITTLIPGIPVLAIMVRYNLLSGKVCGRMGAFFWGVVAPWIVTMFCYETNVLVQFCNWIAIVVQGYINFVVPALLYRAALLRYPQEGDFPMDGEAKYLPSLNDDEELLDSSPRKSDFDDDVSVRFIIYMYIYIYIPVLLSFLCVHTFKLLRVGKRRRTKDMV